MIVASLTTLPQRLPYIRDVLNCLLKQTQPLDKIYLNIPYETLKGLKYTITPDLNEYFTKNRISIQRCKDYGPITKLIPTLYAETDPETVIITFDDDVYISRYTVEKLLEKSKMYPNAVLSFSGFCVGDFPFKYQILSNNKVDKEVDWVQGVHSILYIRKFLNPEELLKDVPNILKKHDDHLVSSYLAKKGIPRISIGYDCKEYFMIFSNVSTLDAISSTPSFLYEILQIVNKFSSEGVYNKSSSPYDSISLYLLLFVVSCVFVIMFSKFPTNCILLLIIFGVCVYILKSKSLRKVNTIKN